MGLALSQRSELRDRLHSHAWRDSSLGPREHWPSNLRHAVEICLSMATPSLVLWGADLTQFYNDAAVALLNGKHPAALGASARDAHAGTWEHFGAMVTNVLTSGTALVRDDPIQISNGTDHECWFSVSCSPLTDQAGEVAGVLIVAFDATRGLRVIQGQQAIEHELRESEARLAAIVNKASVGVSKVNRYGRFLLVNEELCRMLGRTEDELLRMTVADVTLPEDLPASLGAVQHVLAQGEVRSIDKRYLRPDGTFVHASSSLSRLRAADEDALLVVTVDLTERVRAQEALRASEELFRRFADASADALWIRDAKSLAFVYVSPAFETLYGTPRDTVVTDGASESWYRLIHVEDRAIVDDALARISKGERVTFEYRVERSSDAAIVWIRDTGFPIFDAQGNLGRIGGIGQDITEQKRLIDHQSILLAELQHRVRNTLATVRALIQRTMAGNGNVEELGATLLGRIAALARTQVLLTRAADGRVDLRALAVEELQAQADLSCIVINGEDVMLAPKAAEVLTLAVHELTTNSVKYGALKARAGEIRIDWRIEVRGQQHWLCFSWRETHSQPNGGVDPASIHMGFGTELITKRVPYELRGRGVLEVGATGVECSIDFPLADGDSILETRGPAR